MSSLEEAIEEVSTMPDLVATLEEPLVTECLQTVKSLVEKEPACVEISEDNAFFAGDLHGDFETAKAIGHRFIDANHLVFLGDYIDREPMKWGSIFTMTYLFLLKIKYPEKIILLKGNHESNYAIPCYPYEFAHELEHWFGSSVIHDRFVEVFAELPMMIRTPTVFASHGGIIKQATMDRLRTIQKNDRTALEALVWSDPTLSFTLRGAGDPFDEEELLEFLRRIHANVFLRAHDYTKLGISIFHDRCVTILSCRQYQDMGNQGILIARAQGTVARASDLSFEDYSSGVWKKYQVKTL